MSVESNNRKMFILVIGITAATCFGAIIGTSGCRHTHVRSGGNAEDFSFDVSPKGDVLVFTAKGEGEKDIYSFDLKSSRVTPLTKTVDYESDAAFSPDGKMLVYASNSTGERGDHIFIRSLDGTKIKQLTNEDFNDTTPAFSPDGTQIVFARNLTYAWGGLASSWGSDGAIYVMKADGTQLQRLTHDSLITVAPKFSPDGTTIIYWASTPDSKWNIFSIKLTKQGFLNPKPLTNDGYSREVSFSPNGQLVTFVSDPTGFGYAGLFRLFMMKSDGTGRHMLMKNSVANKPTFSPDGEHIYFLGATNNNNFGLWRVDLNGKNPLQIAGNQLFEAPLAFKGKR